MQVNNVSSGTSMTAPTAGNQQLGGDAFLKILVAQLRYQDPMNPMDDRDFIAQMAQFSTLTQIQTLVRHQMTTLGAGLLGRTFEMESASGRHITGRIDSVSWQGDQMMLRTSTGEELTLDDIAGLRLVDDAEG